jgi:hypothetical protein
MCEDFDIFPTVRENPAVVLQVDLAYTESQLLLPKETRSEPHTDPTRVFIRHPTTPSSVQEHQQLDPRALHSNAQRPPFQEKPRTGCWVASSVSRMLHRSVTWGHHSRRNALLQAFKHYNVRSGSGCAAEIKDSRLRPSRFRPVGPRGLRVPSAAMLCGQRPLDRRRSTHCA